MTQNIADIAIKPEEIRQALAKALGSAVEHVVRLSGGASQETWSFDAPDLPRSPGLILRRNPKGIATANTAAMPVENEAALIAAAGASGVPVPQVVRVCEPSDGLGHGFVMTRLEGETIPRKILRDDEYAQARPLLAGQCGAALAGIHKVDASGVTGLPHSPAGAQIEQYRQIYDGFGDPHPVFELALKWLGENMPGEEASTSPTLVHGDFRNGNLIVGPEGLRAVLDWELAHTGDPMEDLGWLCVNSWRFGVVQNPVGGFGTREALFAGYESGGGVVDPDRVHFWEVLGTLKWGIMCIVMVMGFRTGSDRSVERAAIGRRASETEVDLLNLLTSHMKET